MATDLDLADIQGNILSAYGKLGFPKGRFLTFAVSDGEAGRAFVEAVRRRITTALRWPSPRRPHPHGPAWQPRPAVAVNIAFTFMGLRALGVSTRTLRGMPDEFIDGMEGRADIIGDNAPTNPVSGWDPVWRAGADGLQPVHILITLNAQMGSDGEAAPELEVATQWLIGLCAASDGGVRLLEGHRGDQPRYQELSALLDRSDPNAVKPLPTEQFGYVDGISDPVFEGQYPAAAEAQAVIGNGKLLGDQTWAPLATGEFLLGYADEAQEQSGSMMPLGFARNGSFMAYRKLHQNVAAFHGYLARIAPAFAAVTGAPLDQTPQTLMAKIAGRWPDGVPLTQAPAFADWQAVRERRAAAAKANDKATLAALDQALTKFTYRQDPAGAKCPFSAHIRRGNTRDMLDPLLESPNPSDWLGSALNNRRRILRRGLPYGVSPPGSTDDSGEHGIVMLVMCASLFRQFEFVQQQWIQYGLDFSAGNDTCPLIGNHDDIAKFVIPADPQGDSAPYICDRPPQFVETRGGDYFFVPSLTALRMLAGGTIDPT